MTLRGIPSRISLYMFGAEYLRVEVDQAGLAHRHHALELVSLCRRHPPRQHVQEGRLAAAAADTGGGGRGGVDTERDVESERVLLTRIGLLPKRWGGLLFAAFRVRFIPPSKANDLVARTGLSPSFRVLKTQFCVRGPKQRNTSLAKGLEP